ncbi:MAG: PilN domain-containing protein [Candidatus Accumulibacter sp.]|jgi:type IV pilus assembly protein PilN|nr:PilN domain-containing protein [Accumulibacter sp.]
MIGINLLPYREEKRRAKRQQFYGLLGLVSILACLIAFSVYTVIDRYVEAQNAKNDFLKREIASLDKQIDEIKRLREQAQAMLARKQIIESLQRDRAEAVRLLSEVAKQMPEGVYLDSLEQKGARITMVGYAQSNARVSTLMRNIEASQWLENPQLGKIEAVPRDTRRFNRFTMVVTIRRTEVGKTNQEAGKK